ncbi:MAG: 5-formyltetrahydrofolate cyclo-ligase [Anaerovibrio sp.]|uniref:5-formyltetrahydrofolate cyclo-ligase n=1 Tax=Anaerovibrio sp. TaxID=1872532 RepID=UPI0025D4B137|nr:5-formyltetrahydrofolate cyclo-ligase [Anaerovibrio sp.]MCR5175583.1 5-formyltetrahydrofolate cyclo-ligase [Anaerovibrio sp.]
MQDESLRFYKKKLRHEALARRRALTHGERVAESLAISGQLKEMDLYKDAQVVFCYVSVEDEVHTRDILCQAIMDGKRVCVPYIYDADSRIMTAAALHSITELVPGAFDIMTVRDDLYQEIDQNEIDLIIVPGAAFDKKGHRIGMGGGYYDIFLHGCPNADKLAVAYECQLLDEFETENHDITVDYILTKAGLLRC